MSENSTPEFVYGCINRYWNWETDLSLATHLHIHSKIANFMCQDKALFCLCDMLMHKLHNKYKPCNDISPSILIRIKNTSLLSVLCQQALNGRQSVRLWQLESALASWQEAKLDQKHLLALLMNQLYVTHVPGSKGGRRREVRGEKQNVNIQEVWVPHRDESISCSCWSPFSCRWLEYNLSVQLEQWN